MRKKLLVIFVTVLFLGVVTTGYISYNFTRDIILNSTKENLRTECRLIENNFVNYNGNYDTFAKNMKNYTNKRVTIIQDNGKVIGESDSFQTNLGNHSDRPEFIQALKSGEGSSTRFSNTGNETMYYYAGKIDKNGMTYVLRLSVKVDEIEKIQKKYLDLLIWTTVIGIIVCTVIVCFYINIITKPIRMLTKLSTTMSLGHYEKRININSKDEIGQLGNAFNIMASRLQETITDLSDKQSKLISILASMDDGVIVIDNNEKVLIINTAAQKLFELEGDQTGKYFIEITRNKEIHEIIKTIPDEDIEILINYPEKKYLRIKATRVKNYNENLVVMLFIQDITKIKTLEKMRSDFVANVSHELKSPLTSIKGFTETLKYVEDKPTRDKFLDIIYIESERLTRLINDILTLSELENRDSSVNFEKIDINKSIGEVFYIMEPSAKGKNIELKLKLENGEIFIYGDRDKFKQMMINLVDNGIKYTNSGGLVEIKTSKLDKTIEIVVADNGIGIPEKNIARLFERFYRVDKGRSREMGGTGLGLAIVKHIVHLFNGEIRVESLIGNGTSFILDFPSGETNQ